MMTRHTWILLSAMLAGLACSSSKTAGTDAGQPDAGQPDAGSPDAGPVDAGPQLAAPPAPGPMAAPDGTSTTTFAIDKLFLGDTDPDGTPDMTSGWTHYGYNIDGISQDNTAAFCKPVSNASPQFVHQEGVNGIENAFGHLIMPIMLGIESDIAAKVNAGLASGGATTLISIGQLGASASYNPIVTNFFDGAVLGATPKFDGTDVWPVLPDLLLSPTDLSQGSQEQSMNGYLVGNTWVSGPGSGTLQLSITLGTSLRLPLSHVVVTMQLDATHTHVTHGIISGVVPTQVLVEAFKQFFGAIDPSLCGSNPTTDSIVQQLTEASDIMQDGTQDPTKTCDGVSIGLGFDAEQVQLGAIAPAPTPPAPPCPSDGGTP